jgi:hypothetical protein
MKLLLFVFWSSLSFAGSSCYEMCRMHSLPYQQCVELRCPTTPQDWGITCYTDESKLFQLNINVVEKLPGTVFNTANYNVQGVTLSGPRLTGHGFESVMRETRILTRTHTGYNYFLKIDDYGAISLSEIDFSHMPEWFPVGFYGKLKLNNQESDIELSCIKN